MTHHISGLIGDSALLEAIASRHGLPPPAQLGCPLRFLALDDHMSGGLIGPDSPVAGFEYLTPALLSWCVETSLTAPIAYIETEYFAGEGIQGATVAIHGEAAMAPESGDGPNGPISSALELLGVVPAPGSMDAFETAGLSRHRNNDGWRNYPLLTDKPGWMR